MKMIPVEEFNDEQWYHAYDIFYDHDTNVTMGTDPAIYTHKPALVQFYETVLQKVEQGVLKAWLFCNSKEEPIGYILLDKSKGEWELGIAIKDPEQRNAGYGVRATLQVLKWAFEEKNLKWVTAFTQGTDLKVPQMVKRLGFEKFYHFWVMTPQVWKDRWEGRIK